MDVKLTSFDQYLRFCYKRLTVWLPACLPLSVCLSVCLSAKLNLGSIWWCIWSVDQNNNINNFEHAENEINVVFKPSASLALVVLSSSVLFLFVHLFVSISVLDIYPKTVRPRNFKLGTHAAPPKRWTATYWFSGGHLRFLGHLSQKVIQAFTECFSPKGLGLLNQTWYTLQSEQEQNPLDFHGALDLRVTVVRKVMGHFLT